MEVQMNRIHTEAFPFLHFNPLRREEFPGMFVERLSLPWRWHYHRHFAPRAESREAPIFQLGSRGLSFTGRTRLLYGAASFHDGPRVVEVVIPEPRDMEHLAFTIRSILDRIRRVNPSMRLCPSPGSWVKRLPGRKVRIDLLFAPTGADENTLSDEYARRNSLDHHLGRESRLLGRLDRVHIVRGNSPISDHDGAWYIREASLEVAPPFNPVKTLAYSRYSADQLRTPEPLVKGMAIMLADGPWKELCHICGVDAGADAIVPECTVKFDNGADLLRNLSLFSVFDTIRIPHSTLSIQAAERTPLTPAGERAVEATFRERIREIMTAYQDKTGNSVGELISQEFTLMREALLTEDDPSCTPLLDRMEVLSATHAALMTGLPMNDSDYLNATLPVLLSHRTKRCVMPGLTGVALPGFELDHGEILIPRREARRLGLGIGDSVTIYRYPNTGIEMAECRIAGYTDLDAIHIHPRWWTKRFAGDFDGDLMGLIPVGGLVDEKAIGDTESPKSKMKGAMTIIEAVARSLYAKLLIPRADTLATICAERGRDLTCVRQILQSCIDGIKHVIAFPSIEEAYRALDLPPESSPSPVSQLLRGRLGTNRKEYALNYAVLAGKMSHTHSGIAWIRRLEREFALIASPNRRYAELCLGRSTGTLRREYEASLRIAKAGHLFNIDRNMEQSPNLPRSLIRATLAGAIREVNRIAREAPGAIHKAYEVVGLYREWIECLRQERIDDGYSCLHKARTVIQHDEVLGGFALRYLFIAVGYGVDPNIPLKSMKILSYLPIRYGEYNLARYLDSLGFKRSFAVTVHRSA